MAKRRPEPFWRAERKCWFVQLGKKQVRLSADEAEAWRLYHELMARPPDAPRSVVYSQATPVVEILDAFLGWAQANSSPKTFRWRQAALKVFARSIPRDLAVGDLRPHHVTAEMNAHPTWGPDTRANFARCVQRAFSWATDQGMVDRNPIPKIEKPGKGRREDVYTREEYERLLASFPDQEFRDLLTTAWETGCRPQELFAVGAADVDLAGRRWVFKVRDSKGKRKPRVVYLSDAAFEITERLCRERPAGTLFRNRDGQPWDKESASRRFRRKMKLLGRRYCLYGFRHSFATRKLLEGVDAITVALLLGHSNLSMLANQYSHLIKNTAHLMTALNPPKPGAGPPPCPDLNPDPGT
jgi:integrase